MLWNSSSREAELRLDKTRVQVLLLTFGVTQKSCTVWENYSFWWCWGFFPPPLQTYFLGKIRDNHGRTYVRVPKSDMMGKKARNSIEKHESLLDMFASLLSKLINQPGKCTLKKKNGENGRKGKKFTLKGEINLFKYHHFSTGHIISA